MVTVLWLTVFLLAGPAWAWAQVKDRKFEIQTHYALLRLSRLEETASGAGVRVGYNLNDYVAIEGEANYFPRGSGLERKLQFLAGARAGIRNRHYGLFFKARPGVIEFPSLRGSGNRFRFALDVGGVIEAYPTRRLILRLDLGDTRVLIRHAAFPTVPQPTFLRDSYSHNFQLSAGLGFRF